MQVDFSKCVPDAQDFAGWLDKKGSVRKNWKRRYFVLGGGVLKYFSKEPLSSSGLNLSDQKGEVIILGAIVTISEGSLIHITNKNVNDKKHSHTFTLRAKNANEANQWNDALINEIERINIIAIQSGSRIPEVVEWYYQHQAEVARRNTFLTNEMVIDLHYAVPGRVGALGVSKFTITMTGDKLGLLMRIHPSAGGKKFNRIESVNNGRVLLFQDIVGAFLPSGTWEVPNDAPFAFTLMTREDQLSMEIHTGTGPDWLHAVQDMVAFSYIPKPVGRSTSMVMDVDAAAINNVMFEFSANSGAVFASSSDVQMIIEGFSTQAAKSTIIVEIGKRANVILKLIPDMKCNKEAALNFGDRIEDFMRVLGDPESGIIYKSGEWDKTMLNFHLSTLNTKLNDIALYLHTQCQPGWLAVNLNKPNESAKIKFEMFDGEIVNIINTLCKAMSLPASLMFEKKDYSMAVDVRRSVEALGGVEAVYRDIAKERALARLVQADGHEISVEVEGLMGEMGITSRSHGRPKSSSFSSYQSSMDGGDPRFQPRPWWQKVCCCCFTWRRGRKYPNMARGSNKSIIQLEEPLV